MMGIMQPDPIEPNSVFRGKYRIIKKLGEGSFGYVYQAIYTSSGQSIDIAMKFERERHNVFLVDSEHAILNKLKSVDPHFQHFPKPLSLHTYHLPSTSHPYRVLSMQLLGDDLLCVVAALFFISVLLDS